VSQAVTVARLATHELWMTFRLLLVLIVSVGAGAVVSLLPAPLTETLLRLSAGVGVAIAVAAAVAAWSMAEERLSGRTGWLVTRSVARSTYLVGWYTALLLVSLFGLAGGALLGWLAIPRGFVEIDAEYLAAVVAVAATLALALSVGLLAGTLLRPRAAMIVTLALCAIAAVTILMLPAEAAWLPGGAVAVLSRIVAPEATMADALRSGGIGLALTAVVLVVSRIALERTDL